jgi:hypothetical protein
LAEAGIDESVLARFHANTEIRVLTPAEQVPLRFPGDRPSTRSSAVKAAPFNPRRLIEPPRAFSLVPLV